VQHAEVTCVRRLVSGAVPQPQPVVQVAMPYSKPLAPPSHQVGVRVMQPVPVNTVPAAKATAPTCFQAASPQRNGATLPGPMTTACPRDHVSSGSSPLRHGPPADSPRWRPRSPRKNPLAGAQAVADGIALGLQSIPVTRAASVQRPAVNVPCKAASIDVRLAPALSRRGEERAPSPWKWKAHARSQGLPVACEKLAAELQHEVAERQLLEPPVPRSPTRLILGDLSPSDSGLLSPGIFSPFGLPHVAFEEQEANHSKKTPQDTQKRASISPSAPSKRSYCCSTVDDASPFGGSTLSLSFSEDTDCEGALSATPTSRVGCQSPSRVGCQSPSRLLRGQQEHGGSEQITKTKNSNTHRHTPRATRPTENAIPTIHEKQASCGARRFDWASAVADTVGAEESEEDEECLLPCESELIWEGC